MDRIAAEPELTDEAGVEDELFRMSIRPSASGDLLVLAGGITLDAVHQLSGAAMQLLAGGREVAVDWSRSTQVSAGAFQVLLALQSALDARGQAFPVAGDNPAMRRTLELAGLSHFFPLGQQAK